jgi:hypothetical protein
MDARHPRKGAGSGPAARRTCQVPLSTISRIFSPTIPGLAAPAASEAVNITGVELLTSSPVGWIWGYTTPMRCPKCGLENLPSADMCDCGYSFGSGTYLAASATAKKCPFCAELIQADAIKCRFCGERLGSAKRPTAGIAVATIFGLVGLIWSGYAVFSELTTEPAGVRATFYRSFPGYQEVVLIGVSLSLVGNAALLVGAFMSFLYDQLGRTVVRVTSWIMIALIVLQTFITINLVVSSSTWETLDSPTRDGLMGSFVGAALGGAVIQWGLVVFLFRARPAKMQASTSA